MSEQTEQNVKRTRKPRDPNAPRQTRPMYMIYSIINEDGVPIDGAKLNIFLTTRGAPQAMKTLTANTSVGAKSLEVEVD